MQQKMVHNKDLIYKLRKLNKKVKFRIEEDQMLLIIHHNYINDGYLDGFNNAIVNIVEEDYGDRSIVVSCDI